MPRYDVFVAYAGPNVRDAVELYEALAARLGEDRVFIDKKLQPGDVWAKELPAALLESRVTAAVLARTPSGAWYDKSEYAIAIDEMRNGDHVVIPVFADGMPERKRDWPYGLQNLQAIDARGLGGMAAAAEAIAELVEGLRTSTAPDPPGARPVPKTRRELLEAALHLDRSVQWGAIQMVARGDDDAYFLLYGQTYQCLHLFIERILHRLGEETRPHLILELPTRDAGSYAANVHEWEHRLAMALREWLGVPGGSLEELLGAAAKSQPLFVVIQLSWTQALDKRHRKALQAFVEERFPALARAAGGKGKRLLVGCEYQDRAVSLHREVESWMRAAAENSRIRFKPLAEVETPDRDDVVDFLKSCGYGPGQLEYDEILRGYEQIAEGPLDFDRLSTFLDGKLQSGGKVMIAGEEEY